MLVVISDLHLHDGTIAASIDPTFFEMFAERLCEMTRHASWRSSGVYQPIESVDLVLLGDVLDFNLSSTWMTTNQRPWSNTSPLQTVDNARAILRGVAIENASILRLFRAMSLGEAIQIPAAQSSAESITETISVPIRTHYVVGHTDWLLHRHEEAFDIVRQDVAEMLCLVSPTTHPFPHDPDEVDELSSILEKHKVVARHGDLFDPLCCPEERTASGLIDFVQIELSNRFAMDATAHLQDSGAIELASAIKQLPGLHPQWYAGDWLERTLAFDCPAPGLRRRVKQVWDKLVDLLLDMPEVRELSFMKQPSNIDGLARCLKFGSRWQGDWPAQVDKWLAATRQLESRSLVPRAVEEPRLRNRTAKHVVYGHTHRTEQVLMDVYQQEGKPIAQTYSNSGCWQPRLERSPVAQPSTPYVAKSEVSACVFYREDENCGREFEQFTATYGLTDNSARKRRSGQERPFSAPRAQPMSRPHFQLPHGSRQNAGRGRT